jgi:hypothetical protein
VLIYGTANDNKGTFENFKLLSGIQGEISGWLKNKGSQKEIIPYLNLLRIRKTE